VHDWSDERACACMRCTVRIKVRRRARVVHASKMPSVSVRTLDGQVYFATIASFESTTAGKLKTLLEVQHGIPAEHQRLIYCGVVLPLDRPLSEFGVEGGTVLHLVVSAPVPVPSSSVPVPACSSATDTVPEEARATKVDGCNDDAVAYTTQWMARMMRWMFTTCRQSARTCTACGGRAALPCPPPPPAGRRTAGQVQSAKDVSPALRRAVALTQELADRLASEGSRGTPRRKYRT
jgi:ubiquitin-like protein Nedd8